MRRIKGLYFCLCISVSCIAQSNFDWFPFRPATQFNYQVDSSFNHISTVIKIDSTSSSNPYKYYLNKVVVSCDTCQNNLLVNDFSDSTYILNHQAQFAGHSFSRLLNSGFYFKGSSSFVVFPFSVVGNTWIYDTTQNLNATLTAKYTQIIFGQLDSVCVIKLSNLDTIIISKSFGIIQFPIHTVSSHYFKLVGIEGASVYGLKTKTFHDFFDFNVGDVFQYEFTEDDYNNLPPLFKSGHERWDILSSHIYSDSSCYTVLKTYYDSTKYGGSAATTNAYTQTLTISFIDSLSHIANLLPLQEVFVNPYFIFNNGIKHIHRMNFVINFNNRVTKGFGLSCPSLFLSNGVSGAAMETNFPNVFLNKNSSKIVGRELSEGLGFTSTLYNDYDRISQRCLIGYIKGSEHYGIIYDTNPLSIPTINKKEAFFIYPNPANNQINVSGVFNSETQLCIYISFGEQISTQTVYSGNSFVILDAQKLQNGLYFIIISTPNLKEEKKILIQH